MYVKLFVDNTTGSGSSNNGRPESTTSEFLAALDFETSELQELIRQSSRKATKDRAARSGICLTVGLTTAEREPIHKLLTKLGFDVDAMAGPRQTLELTELVPFDLILARLPLPDMPLSSFVKALRSQTSESHGAELFILADGGHITNAQRFLGQGANRVVRLDGDARDLQSVVGDRVRVATRVNLRCAMELYYFVNDEVSTQQCQTINISETGMLLDMQRRVPNRHRFKFSLNIPRFQSPVRGEAKVVRHVPATGDDPGGVGAEIVQMDVDSRENLRDFVTLELVPAK